MAVYTPISLGDIYQQANAIKGQQQRQKLGDLALQQQQTALSNQQGIQSTLASNPNASLADLSKYGPEGVQASSQLSGAKAADLLQQNRQIYVAASQVASADDPVAAAKQVAPNFIADYEKTHGPGSFSQLAPDQVKQLAAGLQQHALLGLVDPDKQFTTQQEMIKAHFTQGQENARSANSIAAENARAAAGRAVTIRGQDLEAGRSNKPQLVEVPNADGTTTKKWLIPGQLEGPTVGTSPPGARLSETQGNAKAFGLRAQDANATLEAMITGPNAYDPTGITGAKDAATAGGSMNFLASDTGQKYQNVAKAFIAPILRKESGAAISESEWKSAKQLYIPIPGDSPTVVAQKARNRADAIEGLRVQAGPTGLPEINQPTNGAQVASGARPDLASLLARPGSAGTDAAQWDKRVDGSQKGNGWLGVLRRPDGGVSSEISVGVNIGGKETEIPLMVPGLTKSEVITLLNSDPKDPKFFSSLPASIKQKAVTFARQRIAQGQSPFASAQESPGSLQAPSHPPAIQSLLDKYK